METIDTTTLPGASSSEETQPVKNQRKAPLSFRPKAGDQQQFIDKLLQEFESPQRVIDYCVNIAMLPESKDSADALTAFKEKESLKNIISQLEAELLTLNKSGVPVPELKLSDDQEKFIQKLIDKKNTNREEAIKFCIIYTKENILWI